MVDNPKKDLVQKIAENQLSGIIPQKDMAEAAKDMSVNRFVEAIDGLIQENVLGRPSYDPTTGIGYNFNPRMAKAKGYL